MYKACFVSSLIERPLPESFSKAAALLKREGCTVALRPYDEIAASPQNQFTDGGAADFVVIDGKSDMDMALRAAKALGEINGNFGAVISTAHLASMRFQLQLLGFGAKGFIAANGNNEEATRGIVLLTQNGLMMPGIDKLWITPECYLENETQTICTADGKRAKKPLTGQEHAVLRLLITANGRTQTKDMLHQCTTNYYETEQKMVDVYICKIRKALNSVSENAGDAIETVWGRGYRIDPPKQRPLLTSEPS